MEKMKAVIFLQALGCILVGYLIGCFSPAYIMGRRHGYDVRESGSGNAGASNVVILAGKGAGFIVAMTDIFKAALAWKLCQKWFVYVRVAGILGGIACMMGHMYPVFLGFRGGKGFACLGGLCLAHNPKVLLAMLGIAIIIGIVTNYICIATVSMSVIFPLYYGISTGDSFGCFLLLLPSIPIFIKHQENFRRIRNGKELRLSYIWKKEEEIARIKGE